MKNLKNSFCHREKAINIKPLRVLLILLQLSLFISFQNIINAQTYSNACGSGYDVIIEPGAVKINGSAPLQEINLVKSWSPVVVYTLCPPCTPGTSYPAIPDTYIQLQFKYGAGWNACTLNNITIPPGGGGLPDLVVTSPTLSAYTVAAGGSLTAGCTVQNQGNATTGVGSTVAFYLSNDNTYGNGDVPLGTASTPILAASATHPVSSTSLSIPSNTTAGTYYVLYRADDGTIITESNDNNNVAASSLVTVTSTPAGLPDLVVTSPTLSAYTVAAGGSLTASCTVQNQGSETTGAGSTLAFYLSNDNTYGNGDVPLGTAPINTLVASATQSVPSTSLSIPSNTTAGTYYVLSRADDGTVITESNDNNNVAASSLVTVTPAPGGSSFWVQVGSGGNINYPGGNVGINETNPTYKLSVNGNVGAKEYKATLNGWSDYVFADGYALMPLAEIEGYIKANRHLPGIPSEKEVLNDGILLGEMNAMLLAKIEELTLHVIELSKEVDKLKAEK